MWSENIASAAKTDDFLERLRWLAKLPARARERGREGELKGTEIRPTEFICHLQKDQSKNDINHSLTHSLTHSLITQSLTHSLNHSHQPSRPSIMDQIHQQADLTGGFSNSTLLLIALNGLTIIFFSLLFICQKSPQGTQDANEDGAGGINYDQALQDADVATLNRAQRRARAKLIMKKNRRLVEEVWHAGEGQIVVAGEDAHDHHAAHDHAAHAPPPADEQVEDGQPSMALNDGPKPSRKERQKAAKELERIERKGNEQQRRIIQSLHQEEERQIREMIQQEKKEQAALDEKNKLEKECRAREYMFPDSDLVRVTVKEFIEELEGDPVLSLQDTAEEFAVSVGVLVERLEELESEGRICHGILNLERDEYVYVNGDCMARIAMFVKDKGCVSLEDVAGELAQIVACCEDEVGLLQDEREE